MSKPIYVTIGFKCVDRAAFDVMWKDICDRYKFCAGDATTPAQAFAVSMGDMFEQNEVLDAFLESDLDQYDMKEAIGAINGNDDLRALCAEYDIKHPYARTPDLGDVG